jgi:hypothetical protein
LRNRGKRIRSPRPVGSDAVSKKMIIKDAIVHQVHCAVQLLRDRYLLEIADRKDRILKVNNFLPSARGWKEWCSGEGKSPLVISKCVSELSIELQRTGRDREPAK